MIVIQLFSLKIIVNMHDEILIWIECVMMMTIVHMRQINIKKTLMEMLDEMLVNQLQQDHATMAS